MLFYQGDLARERLVGEAWLAAPADHRRIDGDRFHAFGCVPVDAAIVASLPLTAEADALALVGENRKLLVVPLEGVPVMARGQGVALQKYKDGGLSDALPFLRAAGLSWTMGGAGNRTRSETDLTAWVGARGSVGRTPPLGFPRDNKF